jgi:hypothetical protein
MVVAVVVVVLPSGVPLFYPSGVQLLSDTIVGGGDGGGGDGGGIAVVVGDVVSRVVCTVLA